MASRKEFSKALRRSALLEQLRDGTAILFALAAAMIAWAYPLQEVWAVFPWPHVQLPWWIEEQRVAEAVARGLHGAPERPVPPPDLKVLTWNGFRPARAKYLIDEGAQGKIRALFSRFRPDQGAFVALDAETGRVLTLVSYSKTPSDLGHLALRAIFPAASVFKLVTAAAAIDEQLLEPESVITFRGRDHTLFKNHLTQGEDKWGRKMTLREAFAKSVNTVFGKIGAFVLSPNDLDDYASRFLFNRAIAGDIAVDPGHFVIGTQDDPWERAELASGFNRASQMSPLQGALMAAAIANDGLVMEPHILEKLEDERGGIVYAPRPKELGRPVTAQSADRLRVLMRETVVRGTSRKSFRGFTVKFPEAIVEVGGKTGSLMGQLPRGRCDWFIGYARAGGRRVAMAALTVNERYAPLKSSFVARTFLEYFLPQEAGPGEEHSTSDER